MVKIGEREMVTVVPGECRGKASVLPCGDSALTVQFENRIDASVNDAVLSLQAALLKLRPAVIETIPTYCSLLVRYDPEMIGFDALKSGVLSACREMDVDANASSHWEIPVVYGGTFGIDLDAVASKTGMTSENLVKLHSKPVYRVYMIGFVPGFAYLGGLDPLLFAERLPEPRLSAPTGSITIGGMQTAITSIEAPCGWHQIGRTPVRLFKPDRDPICLLAAGDTVRFTPINAMKWHALALKALSGDWVARRR